MYSREYTEAVVAVGFPFISARSQTADDKITTNRSPNGDQEDKDQYKHKALSS